MNLEYKSSWNNVGITNIIPTLFQVNTSKLWTINTIMYNPSMDIFNKVSRYYCNVCGGKTEKKLYEELNECSNCYRTNTIYVKYIDTPYFPKENIDILPTDQLMIKLSLLDRSLLSNSIDIVENGYSSQYTGGEKVITDSVKRSILLSSILVVSRWNNIKKIDLLPYTIKKILYILN